jgi:mRNA interferase MazF
MNQGDIFWVSLGTPSGSAPGYRHPHVVVQNNLFNRSRINTVVVCALTSNLKRATAPGNVLLNRGEAGLSKQSVVNISQIFTVDKSDLFEKIGTLSPRRVREILDGIRLLTEPRDRTNAATGVRLINLWAPNFLIALIDSPRPKSLRPRRRVSHRLRCGEAT